MLRDTLPSVSVIMPVRNEAAFIISNLEAVLSQDYLSDSMEVIVADGMSNDGTREIVDQFIYKRIQKIEGDRQRIKNSFSRVVLVDNPGKIMPAGANIAIRHARGDVIVLLGGHVIIPPDYVRRCVEWLMKTGADCVGGIVESIGVGYVGEAIAAAMSSAFGVGDSGFRTAAYRDKPLSTDTVPFGAYRRDVFDRVGLFNEQMVRHQDYEFHYRLRKAGGRIMLLPSARVKYYVRSSLSTLWKQYWQYGIWKGRFLRTYPDSLKIRHLMPPVFVFSLIVTSLSALVSQVGLVALWFILGTYATFIFAALISLKKSGRSRYAPILPVIFSCLHLSWGLGVWLGLFSRGVLRPQDEKQK